MIPGQFPKIREGFNISEKKSAWTDADTEAMFATIGRYIVIFQWIESKLDEILLLGWKYEKWERSQETRRYDQFRKSENT